ncbi:MAG TPA: S8 family serine peptidase [Candidatus Krumholzibacteria bacterium]|nr:S8 family serine peptidase [Candidatus Krumholzibacteria bacterium]
MKRVPPVPAFGITIVTLALLCAGTFASAQTRTWSPVQQGFSQQASDVTTYAPDRVLIRLTPEATRTVRSALGRSIGGSGIGSTGVLALDQKFRRHGVQSVRAAYALPQRAEKARQLGVDRWMIVDTDGGVDPAVIARDLRETVDVERATVDWRAFPAAVPSDPMYPDQWGHDNTAQMLSYDWATFSHENGEPVGTVGFDANAELAWDQPQVYGATDVVVAILDSGVDVNHPDLRLVPGYDFGDDDSNPDDDSSSPGHGTACAGVAAAIANNGLGVAGIAGGSSVMPVKVADSSGAMYFSYIQNALYWAADNGADVISMSLGAAISSDPATDTALQYAHDAGSVILAATGNENASTISYPAVHDVVIGVGAASPCGDRKRSSSSRTEVNSGVNTDPNGYTCDGERWWGSNYGSTTPDDRGAVDVIAPTILPTTDISGSGGYAAGDYDMWFNGTSAATPYAAGVAALVISADPAKTPLQVRDALTSTAQDIVNVESVTGWDRYSGYGMVDAAAAVGAGSEPVAPVAAFSSDTTSGTAPLTVNFTDQSSGAPTSWSWDFGDGSVSTVQNPSYTYDVVGTYTVSLTVSNDVGTDTVTQTEYVTVTEPGSATVATALEDLPVLGTVSGSYLDTHSADGVSEVVTETLSDNHPRKVTSWAEHQWRFDLPVGDQVTLTARASRSTGDDDFVFAWSTDQATWNTAFTVASAAASDYSATLPAGTSGTVYVRVVDTDRSWDLTSLDAISVDALVFEIGGSTPTAPVAAFSGTPTSGTVPLTVQFADESTGTPTSWSWDFGDGTTSVEANPSHTYQAVGTYTVSLTVSNDIGSDSITKTDYVTVSDAPVGGTMSVATIAVTRKVAGPNNAGQATVVIQDSGGAPVANATVTGVFTGPVGGTFSGLTQSDGSVFFETGKTRNASGEWCFEVTDVTHASLSYDAGSNAVTKACESGNVFAADATRVDRGLHAAPNPFNPATEISFSLDRPGRVELHVFDPRGRRVSTLVDQVMPAGERRLTWQPDRLSSGVYFLRLVTEEGTQIRRAVLLK